MSEQYIPDGEDQEGYAEWLDQKTEIESLRAEVARLREERLIVPVMGEIVDMEFSSELGVYYGTIRCPKCNWEGEVSPMADRPKCRCRIEWDFSVSAAGTLPQGPETGEVGRE